MRRSIAMTRQILRATTFVSLLFASGAGYAADYVTASPPRIICKTEEHLKEAVGAVYNQSLTSEERLAWFRSLGDCTLSQPGMKAVILDTDGFGTLVKVRLFPVGGGAGETAWTTVENVIIRK